MLHYYIVDLLVEYNTSFFLAAQIGAFFLVFYFVVGGIFVSHVAVFVAIAPDPAEDAQPQNFGRYAYPNYPNAKIGMIKSTVYT